MSAPSFADLAPEYAAQWARMTILPARSGEVERAARDVASGRDRYAVVETATRVPWFVVGLLHLREASLDFRSHLHNGDPLTRRTTHVPAGRPVDGAPPYTWSESAIDAMRYDGLDRVGLWPLEAIAYRAEAYNGFGPRNHGSVSGYLWAGSTLYGGGKYVADGVWAPGVWDKQLGVMTVLRRMVELGLAVIGAPSATIAAKGHTAEDLQVALNRALGGVPGFDPLIVDGSIGRITRAAIRLFQGRAGLDADGVAGPLTWAALDRIA